MGASCRTAHRVGGRCPAGEGRFWAACGAPRAGAPPPAVRRGRRHAVMEPASPTGWPRTPFPAATTSMSEGRSGLRIVSVVPPPYAMGPRTGADVIVAYLPVGARVVPSRCRLTVNGRRQGARMGSSMLSPVQPIPIFSWAAPYPPGNYRFRVTVVARGGQTATAKWTYAYR